MATYTTLAPGSRGDQVRRLQTRLNGHGADLAVDGVYGPKTRDAVKNYQTARDLTADGVAGRETWSRLMEGTAAELPAAPPNAAAPSAGAADRHVSPATAEALARYEAGYTPGDAATRALEAWQATQTGGPGGYESPYQAELEALYGEITGRRGFDYDPESDPLYRQYRDQYVRLGRAAMDDTLGRAAGLTGGFASSYGQSAGQQAYDGYLQQLNSKVPELYRLALDRYNAEGDALTRRYRLMSDAEAAAYDRWRSAADEWRAAGDAAYRRYTEERSADYDRWSGMLDYWRRRADEETDAWWRQAQWDDQRERAAVEDQRWEREFARRAAETGASENAAPNAAPNANANAAGPLVHVPPYGYIDAAAARDMVAGGELAWVMKDDRRTVLTDAGGSPIARRIAAPRARAARK